MRLLVTVSCFTLFIHYFLLLDFSLTVKAAPHECVIRTGQAENEAWFYLKVIVSSCANISV